MLGTLPQRREPGASLVCSSYALTPPKALGEPGEAHRGCWLWVPFFLSPCIGDWQPGGAGTQEGEETEPGSKEEIGKTSTLPTWLFYSSNQPRVSGTGEL